MKFDFENLGPIKKGQVELGDLKVICGRNNVGKTYLSHSIWGLLNQNKQEGWINVDINEINAKTQDIIPNLEQSITVDLNQINLSLPLKEICEEYTKTGLSTTFNTDSVFFKDTTVNLQILKASNEKVTSNLLLTEDGTLHRNFKKRHHYEEIKIKDIFIVSVNKNENEDFLEF